MSVENYVIADATQKAAIEAESQPGAGFWGKPIDSTNPGVGINLNPDATDFEAGDPVPLSPGKYVFNVRSATDPEVITNAPDAIPLLIALPWCLLENETIFAPEEPV